MASLTKLERLQWRDARKQRDVERADEARQAAAAAQTPDPVTRTAASSRQVALIALVAALLSAVVSIGGGFISTWYATNAARDTTAQQIQAENRRNNDDFLRTQRQSLYRSLLKHQYTYFYAETNLAGEIGSKTKAQQLWDGRGFDIVDARLTKLQTGFNNYAFDVSVVASAEVLADYNKFKTLHNRYYGDASSLSGIKYEQLQHRDSKALRREWSKINDDQLQVSADQRELLKKLQAHMRTDLGSR